MNFGRRAFFVVSASAAIAGSFLYFWPDSDLLPDRLAGLFRRYKAQAKKMGERYIECSPAPSGTQEVVAMLDGHGNDPTSTLPMRERVDNRILQDFREGRTVIVDGWLLSETEAKLCALIARKG